MTQGEALEDMVNGGLITQDDAVQRKFRTMIEIPGPL